MLRIPIPPGEVNRESDGVHFTYMRAAVLCPSSRYLYGGTAYAKPDAVTSNGNLAGGKERTGQDRHFGAMPNSNQPQRR